MRFQISILKQPTIGSRQWILRLMTGLIVCALSIVSTQTWARCALAPAELKGLNAKLEASSNRATWASIWNELTELESRLLDGDTQVLTPERAVTLQCLYGLLFDTSFYLAGSALEAPLWSIRGLGAKLLLENIEAQSERPPSRSEQAQRALRIRELQRNLARLPQKKGQWSPWMSAQGSVQIDIPALTRVVNLSIQHPHPEQWKAQCGLTSGCDQRPTWTIRLPIGQASILHLPKADYHLKWSGHCADEQGSLKLLKAKEKKVLLNPPTLACRSEVTLLDTLSQERWPVGMVEEGQTKSFQHPGYQEIAVTGKEGGGPMTVILKRCEIPLTWVVTPYTAHVEVPIAVEWGVPTTIKATQTGYAPLTRLIELPRSDLCQSQPHHLDLALSREVRLNLSSPTGRPLHATSLKVSGLDEPLHGHTRRPPGRYQGFAQAKGFQSRFFELSVPPCHVDQYEPSDLGQGSRSQLEKSRCLPYERTIKLENIAPPNASIDQQLKRFGWITAIAGATLFTTHAFGIVDYQSLSYSKTLDSKHEALKRGQLLSYSLLGSGALLYGLGLLWPALSTTSSVEGAIP